MEYESVIYEKIESSCHKLVNGLIDGCCWFVVKAGIFKSGAKKGGSGRPVSMLSQVLLARCGALP